MPGKNQEAILIPVDFGDHYPLAIEYGVKLAGKLGVAIHLLHALDIRDWWLDDVDDEGLVNEAFNKLVAIAKQYKLPDSTRFRVKKGKRRDVIVSYANDIDARYILMVDNYPNAKGIEKIGSTLSSVIITSTQPVITVKSVPENLFKQVLVPLDLTRDCRLKLFNSVAIALAFDSTLHLASVVFGDIEPEDSRIASKIEKYSKLYQENSIDYSVKILKKDEDYAYKAIIDYAQEIGCDSIVIMTHRESASFDNYLGGFAHHIINESPVPVVTLNNAASTGAKRGIFKTIFDPLNLFS